MRNLIRYATAIALFAMLLTDTAKANYMRVSNVSYNQAIGTISFDIAWDNSWRLDGSQAPFNWDAAWVFAKWRECGAPASDPWIHGKVDPAAANSFGSLEPHAEGFPGGYYPDSNGVMLRRNATGLFPSAGFTTVTIDFANFPAVGDYDVRVFGIEMVYINGGEFLLGNSSTESNRFHSGNAPILITSEAAQNVTSSAFSTNSNVALGAAYPKGFDAFYIMKYEISQGQYSEFLNTVSSTAQGPRFLGPYNNDRNRLNSTAPPPDIYWSDRPDRAQNWMNWGDLAGYLDWAALRPFSEMEYEKAARGQGPAIPNEYCWGTTSITRAENLSTPENGTEVVLNANANCRYNNFNLVGGDGGFGPIRVGIFATPATSSRQETGASYYGVMELSGNVFEQAVNVSNQTCATCSVPFDGQWGDGYLDGAGNHNVPNWPVSTGAIQGRAMRGGAYSFGAANQNLANRQYFASTTSNRLDYLGGRGAR